MSTYPSVAEVDTDLSKASGACPWHLSRAGQVAGAEIELFNLEGCRPEILCSLTCGLPIYGLPVCSFPSVV